MRTIKVLITGVSGYIGSILAEVFANKKNLQYESVYQVTGVDNLMYQQKNLISLCSKQNFNFVYGDIRNNDLMRNLIKDHDVIINLAAIVGAPSCMHKPNDANEINFLAVKNNIVPFLGKEQLLLFPNTNSGYGIGGEDYCTEESELKPISLYGKTKVLAEEEIRSKVNNYIIFRLATVFGVSPRMRLDLLVNDFVYKAYTDRYIVLFEHNFRRNFVHILDVANAFNFVIEKRFSIRNEIFNLGLDDANLTKMQLCEKIKQYIYFVIQINDFQKDPDQRDYIVSNKKILDKGFNFYNSLDDGIIQLLKAYNILGKQYTNL